MLSIGADPSISTLASHIASPVEIPAQVGSSILPSEVPITARPRARPQPRKMFDETGLSIEVEDLGTRVLLEATQQDNCESWHPVDNSGLQIWRMKLISVDGDFSGENLDPEEDWLVDEPATEPPAFSWEDEETVPELRRGP